MLSAGLTALVHQQMHDGAPRIKYLFTEPDSPGDPVRSIIREGKIGMLSTYIDRASARLNAATPVGTGTGSIKK